jgi:hypothetical protein
MLKGSNARLHKFCSYLPRDDDDMDEPAGDHLLLEQPG